MMRDGADLVRATLESFGLAPTKGAQFGMALENGWNVQLGYRPTFHVCVLIPCAAWEFAKTAEYILRRNDARRGHEARIQTFIRDDRLGLLVTMEDQPGSVDEFRRTILQLIVVALEASQGGA